MISSRIVRSLSRSSRAKDYLRGDAKLGTLLGATRTNVHSEGTELGLGFFREYVAHARARGNGILSSLHDFQCVAANPKIHYRLFSSEGPKTENYENSYPKEKKEIPKGEDQKHEFKVNLYEIRIPFKTMIISALLITLVTVLALPQALFGGLEGKRITFQEFKNELLEPGLVDHIVVSNLSVAKVYVRNTPRNQTDNEVVEGTLPAKGTGGQCKFYFDTGKLKSFEENLEAAQEALGLDPHDYVPVTYSFEVYWGQAWWFAPTVIAVFLATHKNVIRRVTWIL